MAEPETLRVHIPLTLRNRGGRPRILPPKDIEVAMDRRPGSPPAARHRPRMGLADSAWSAATSPPSPISPQRRASPTAMSAA